ncbi:nucleolar protein 11-like [Styela clava]
MTTVTNADITNLTSKRKGSTFLGWAKDPGSDFVVLAFNSSLSSVQVNDNRVIKTWSCTRGRKNTSSVVFDSEEKEFVVVQNEKVLRTFKETNLDDAMTFTLKHKIHCLVQCQGHKTFVLLDDGSLFHLHYVLEDPQEIFPDASIKLKIKEIMSVSSFVKKDGNLCICSICDVENNEYAILASSIHSEENEVSHCIRTLQYEGRKLKATSEFHESATPVITTVWSDGSLCLLCVSVINNEINIQLDKVTTVEIDENVQMTSLSSDQVAVLCKGQNVHIIDLKFGTTIQKMEIGCNVAKMTTIENFILLDTPNHVKKLPFTSNPVTLSSVILKQRQGQQTCQVHCAKWTDQPKQTLLLNEKDNNLLEILLKTEQEANFDRTWTKFWKGKSQDNKKQFSRSNTMKEILNRFGTDEKKKVFWPRSTILEIVSTGWINGGWCDKIFQEIYKMEDWDLLQECLKNLTDIPETVLVQCLTLIAAKASEDITLDTIQYNDSAKKDKDLENNGEQLDFSLFPQHLYSCINEILQLPYSENALRKELSSVPFNAILKIVLHLTNLLENIFLGSESPTLNQVISWLGMIIDAHLSEIILLEDSWPAISKLQEAVDLQSKVFTELTTVSRLLTQIQSKLPAGKKSKELYTVEIMKF